MTKFNKLQSGTPSDEQIAAGFVALSKRFDGMQSQAATIMRDLEIIRGQIRLVAADKQIPMEKLQ